MTETHDSAVLVETLKQKSPRPLSIKEIAHFAGLGRFRHKALKAALEEQVQAGVLRRIGKSRYQWVRPHEAKPKPKAPLAPRKDRLVEGRYARVLAGYGFVEATGAGAERFTRDIRIPEAMEGEALDGDKVLVEIIRIEKRTGRYIGRITDVVERRHETVLGALEQHGGTWWLVPESPKLPRFELTGANAPKHRDEGMLAVARMIRPPSPHKAPGAELVEILGSGDDPEAQFRCIVMEHGIRHEFPPEVLAEADRYPKDPSEPDFAGREDLRALPFVTIDGESARDFDDALCLEELGDGGCRLRVAIADVSHYVREGSHLDAEARERGTSVYFPDRAVPMLPEALSNGLCSLNPDRPRLVMVADMTLDSGGARQRSRFYRSVIQSRARLTYTAVAAMLSETDTEEINALRTRHAHLLPMLRGLQLLMKKLYAARVRNGSLDLDLPEALLDLSEEGRAVGLRLSLRNDAHRIVEECMLEANRAVAVFLKEQKVPFPYRIHEPPDAPDIDELNAFLQPFGLGVDYEGDVRPHDVQGLLSDLAGHRLSRVLSRLVLRSLKQAQYNPQNAGHFGLAFRDYCHFTSPIRRYPDLLVHRQLGRVLDNRHENARERAADVADSSALSSQREREAMEAERAMADLKKAEFMLGHLLEPEPGTVVSVTPFGVFVELDAFPVEGLVHVDNLGTERFYYEEESRALVASRSGQRLSLGDRVLVQASNVSLRKRQVDFELLERLEPALPPGTHRGPRSFKKEHPKQSRPQKAGSKKGKERKGRGKSKGGKGKKR